MSSVRVAVALTIALAMASCSGAEQMEADGPGEQGDCVAMLGVYPPETIVMEGLRRVDVPYTSWSCPGYDSDTFADQVPTLMTAPTGEVSIKIELLDDPVFEIRALTEADQISLDGEVEGESLLVRLPDTTERLLVRMCTSDGRCANYEANVES